MDFTFTDDQLLFRDAVRDLFANECPPEAVRSAWESADGRVPGLWAKLAEMGVVGLTAPESSGGLGMNELDLVLLLEEAGRVALPEPLVAHTAVGLATLADVSPDHPLLASGAAGETVLSAGIPSSGTTSMVLGAEAADGVIVRSVDELHLLQAGEFELSAVSSMDESRRMSSMAWTQSPVTLLSDDPAMVDRAFARGALATAAMCVGLAQQMLDMTVEYVKEREQFGKPVGVNQAVKHHCSNMGLAIEFARPLVYQAAWSMSAASDQAVRDVSAAKVLASDAADLCARLSLQCHGAIGYTVEYDLQLWLKRAWALSAEWGSAALHRQWVARSFVGR